MPPPRSASAYIHHERQSRLLCGLHALNCLLQREFGPHFTKADLDLLCDELDPPRCCHVNRHRHWAGMGDYDVNVLLYALSSRGLESAWWDARLPASRLRERLTAGDSSIVGLLVNGAGFSSANLGGANHWYALRRIGASWWDLNSLHRAPRRFADVGEMCNDLQALLDMSGNVIVIRTAGARGGGSGGATSAGKGGSARAGDAGGDAGTAAATAESSVDGSAADSAGSAGADEAPAAPSLTARWPTSAARASAPTSLTGSSGGGIGRGSRGGAGGGSPAVPSAIAVVVPSPLPGSSGARGGGGGGRVGIAVSASSNGGSGGVAGSAPTRGSGPGRPA